MKFVVMGSELSHEISGFRTPDTSSSNISDGLGHLGIPLPPSLAVVSFHQILLFSAAFIAVPILALLLQRHLRSGQQRRGREPVPTADCDVDEGSNRNCTSLDAIAPEA